MRKVLFLILSFFLISACSMPDTKIYSLYIPESDPIKGLGEVVIETNPKTGAALVILVQSPRYLAQPYIAHRNSPFQIEISKYSKWVSPPSEVLKEALKDSLLPTNLFSEIRTSKSVPEGFFLLEVSLKKFERFDEGSESFGSMMFGAKLVSPEGKVIYQETISKHIRLEDRTFLSLAVGLSRAFSESMEEVREGVIMSVVK